ncbi:oxsm protein [Salpingoeca rosetta]|uniref:3-oxoacyl-[acyl-carrier-protein] synthase n=1 Tax=Salpingoeca rosetta (strain ATCC 50818 / BSB-021) TaxID=946362 RepID=F2UAM7_SALR5|nr:oxsm protein [Salpingoeca rosetta]EGD73443.1 oxsm protein [Salpingoeca rosetta]|eukprot:XP_004993725.1 oxsm protein [Salpingoeca rosetta]
MSARRVVVTGLGAVSPLSATARTTWQRVVRGDCAIGMLPELHRYEEVGIPTKLAATVPRVQDADSSNGSADDDALVRFDAPAVQARHGRRTLPDSILYALSAADEAIADAGLADALQQNSSSSSNDNRQVNGARAGVAVGTGISGLQDLIAAHETLHTRGYRRVSPYLIPNSLVNMAAGLISIDYGLRGPNHAVSTACATGAHAIGDAYRFIKYGDADVMVCGGADACIMPVVVAGFARAKALATGFDDAPEESSRPFDRRRSGFVIGEGAALFVLEELEHARARGAHIYAEVRGYGLSGDAHHVTAPHESGDGAYRAMRAALDSAGVDARVLDHINAHATSTPLGDGIECRAIKALLAGTAAQPTITATKGATGHLLGAAGSLEAMFAVMSIHAGVVPPTLNLHEPLEEAEGLHLVANTAQQQSINFALSNSFGFGGTNVSLLFSKPDA